MNHENESICRALADRPGSVEVEELELFPGIELSYMRLNTDRFSVDHPALDHVLEINYCRSGRMGWDMGNGNSVYLGPRDFSLHTLSACAHCALTLPNEYYEGITLFLDLNRLTQHPPELLSGTGITGEALYEKFCRGQAVTSLAGSEATEQIFSGFFCQPSTLRLSYQRLKALELILYLSEVKIDRSARLTEYRSEQVAIIRAVHRHLLEHMDQRITIDELSRRYAMNPTTLKALFKSVYGESIAAHIKAHRMEEAARLLRQTDLSMAEVAQRVGYDSQSRFASAFKAAFSLLPTEYRRRNG